MKIKSCNYNFYYGYRRLYFFADDFDADKNI